MNSEIAIGIFLGLVEGVTEYIPVSSTGHLILAGNLISFTGARAETFEIFIQLGAILAAVVLYWRRFTGLAEWGRYGRGSFRGISGLAKIGVACMPALICGKLFHAGIKEHLFHPLPVAIALIFGGVVMILVERRRSPGGTCRLEEVSLLQCLGIGVIQCLSLWPGISRSGSTIVGGLLVGLRREVAAELSFLLAVPVLCAAVGYELFTNGENLAWSDLPLFGTGFVVSFLSAMVAIRALVRIVSRATLAPFGYYRIALGLLVVAVGSLT